jgi:hypothetical protein
MAKYRILNPEAARVGNTSLAGGIVDGEALKGRDIPALLESKAIEKVEETKARPANGPDKH